MSPVDPYPMPRMDELLGQAEYISALDLAKGYWQVPAKEEDRLYLVLLYRYLPVNKNTTYQNYTTLTNSLPQSFTVGRTSEV